MSYITETYNEIADGEKNPIFNVSSDYYKKDTGFAWYFKEITEELKTMRDEGAHIFVNIDSKLKPTQVRFTTNPEFENGEFVTMYFNPTSIVNDDAIASFEALTIQYHKNVGTPYD